MTCSGRQFLSCVPSDEFARSDSGGFMKRLLAVIALSFAALGAHAGVTILGYSDCGDWVHNNYVTDKGWLLGYLSAMNSVQMGFKMPDTLKGVTGEQILLWMDNYCKANPLSTLQDGAMKLNNELVQRVTSPNR
jgi:hypothetical protein